MKKLLSSLLIFALFFTLGVGVKNFALGQNDKNEKKEHNPVKVEKFMKNENKKEDENNEEKAEDLKIEEMMKEHMEKVMKQIEKINEEMEKGVKHWGGKGFFVLNPGNNVMAGGILENNTSQSFTLNSNGFRTNWVIATDTKVVGSNKQELNISSLQANSPVRVKGKFDGQNLVAEVIIVLQPVQVPTTQIQNLLLQIINILREKGVNLTPILQQPQTPTTTQ